MEQEPALLERYLAGDDDAFRSIVSRHGEKLYAFLARMMGDSRLAEEIFRQTFTKAAKNAAAFDNSSSFSAWLYRIARNAALDELRRRGAPPETMDFLAAIPEQQREAFLLKEEGELSFDQVGSVLGCGTETAKDRFRLAVNRIRSHWEQSCTTRT